MKRRLYIVTAIHPKTTCCSFRESSVAHLIYTSWCTSCITLDRKANECTQWQKWIQMAGQQCLLILVSNWVVVMSLLCVTRFGSVCSPILTGRQILLWTGSYQEEIRTTTDTTGSTACFTLISLDGSNCRWTDEIPFLSFRSKPRMRNSIQNNLIAPFVLMDNLISTKLNLNR